MKKSEHLVPEPVFFIQHYGTSSHSSGHDRGGFQETRALYGDTGLTPAPVRVVVKDGVRLAQPQIIRFES